MTDGIRDPSRLLLTIPQVAERLQIGRSSVYQLIGSGQLATLRFGRSVRVLVASVDALVQDRLAEAE